MPITIYRKGYPNRWEAVATAKVWTIADAIGNMLSRNGDEVRATCGSLTVNYTDGEREEVSRAAESYVQARAA